MRNSWDKDYIDLADFWAQRRSRDPSTKVGAVIVRPDDKTPVMLGFNGFAAGVEDSDERYDDRPTKYQFVCHAEENAIVKARTDLTGCTIYTSPLHPCSNCAKMIIQAGIKRVVTRKPDEERWQSSYDVAQTMFREAGVQLDFVANDA